MRPCSRFNLRLLFLTVLIGAGIFSFVNDAEAKAPNKTVRKSLSLNFSRRPLAKLTDYDLKLSDNGYFVEPLGTKEIYWFGPDKKIYSVPDYRILISWFGNSKIPLKEFSAHASSSKLIERFHRAGPLFPRAGTYLLKFGTSTAIYALEPKGLLRPIENEVTAVRFYGPKWNKKIIVFKPGLKPYFNEGRLLTYNDYPPEGTLVKSRYTNTIHQAKWKQLTLITKNQWDNCNFLPRWVTEGDWEGYPENHPYFDDQLLNCKPEDQMPKLITPKNKLAQKDHLRVLIAEFIEPSFYDPSFYPGASYFDLLNSKHYSTSTENPSPTMYSIKDWFEVQYERSGRKLKMDLNVVGPYQLGATYDEVMGSYASLDGSIIYNASPQLMYRALQYLELHNINVHKYDIVNIISYDFYRGKLDLGLFTGSLGKFNLIRGRGSLSFIGDNLLTISHEMLHSLGADDIHQNRFLCPEPDGLADPFQEPQYPQQKINIMCAGKFISRGIKTNVEDNLYDAVLGESVIRDFGWK